MATYTLVVVAPDELEQDDVVQIAERIGVVAFCGPGAASVDGSTVRVKAGDFTVQMSAEVTDDGPVVRVSGVDCDLSRELPGEEYWPVALGEGALGPRSR